MHNPYMMERNTPSRTFQGSKIFAHVPIEVFWVYSPREISIFVVIVDGCLMGAWNDE